MMKWSRIVGILALLIVQTAELSHKYDNYTICGNTAVPQTVHICVLIHVY